MSRTIYVRNLPPEVTDRVAADLFAAWVGVPGMDVTAYDTGMVAVTIPGKHADPFWPERAAAFDDHPRWVEFSRDDGDDLAIKTRMQDDVTNELAWAFAEAIARQHGTTAERET